MMNRYTSLLLLTALLTSCSNDTPDFCPSLCSEGYDLGYFPLSSETIDLFPYDSTTTAIVLVDSIGNEYKGLAQVVQFRYYSSVCGISTCVDDPDQQMKTKAHFDYWHSNFLFDDLNLDLRIDYSVYVNHYPFGSPASHEIATIKANQIERWWVHIPLMEMYIDIASQDWFSPYHEFSSVTNSVQLLDQEYDNIYSSDSEEFPHAQVYFSLTDGLVGIRIDSTNAVYVVDRVE